MSLQITEEGLRLAAVGICDRAPGHDGPCKGYPNGTCWQHISTCPSNHPVLTRLCDNDDGDNARNVDTRTIRYASGNKFYLLKGDAGPETETALLTYTPTHWRWRNRTFDIPSGFGNKVPKPLSPAESAAGNKLVTIDTVLLAAESLIKDYDWDIQAPVSFLRRLREMLELA